MASKVFRKLQVIKLTTDFKAATKLVEVPLRDPSANEIRVRNIYAGVNATDVNITAGRYARGASPPFDFGLESLGVVDALGPDASNIKIGQPVVVSSLSTSGSFSEYLYTSAKSVFPVPLLKPEYLVALVNGLTASIGLDEVGRIKKGDKVLITAAAGGTGQVAVQWAKHRGAEVVALTSSDEKAAYLKQELGVDHVINYRSQDLDKQLAQQFPEGVDVVWETVGGQTFTTLFKHLSTKGRLVIVGKTETYKDAGLATEILPGNLTAKLLVGSKTLSGLMISHYAQQFPEYFGKLVKMIDDGQLKAKVDLGHNAEGGPFLGLENAWKAEQHLHNAKNVGKVVVKIQEP